MSDIFFLEAQHVPELCVYKQVASNLANYTDTSVSQNMRTNIWTISIGPFRFNCPVLVPSFIGFEGL